VSRSSSWELTDDSGDVLAIVDHVRVGDADQIAENQAVRNKSLCAPLEGRPKDLRAEIVEEAEADLFSHVGNAAEDFFRVGRFGRKCGEHEMNGEAGADESTNERKMWLKTEIADAVLAGAFAFFSIGQKTAMPKHEAENLFCFCGVSWVRWRINEGATNVADAVEKPAGARQPARARICEISLAKRLSAA